MLSAKSFFNPTVYRKTLTRFWPLWAVNLVFWLFLLPLNGLVQLTNYIDSERKNRAMIRFMQNIGDLGCEAAVVFSIIAGLVIAMAVCSHMYNNRSANFMASLPVRREGQFVSTYLAGLTMLIAPNVIIFLLTLLVEAAAGMVLWTPLLFWLGSISAMEFFFYSFAVCLAQFAGHILAVPVYYGVFNCIFLAAYALIGEILRSYYFGFSNAMFDYTWAYWLTPAAALWEIDFDMDVASMDLGIIPENIYAVEVEGLWIAGVYAIVGLILTVCALLLHRRRHMETAGDIVAVKAMRPVFKYGVSVCAGLCLGIFTTMMLGLHEGFMMVSIIIWAIIGYFVAQMLLDKSFRVFKKWKGAAAVTAAFLVMFAVIAFDLTGYETRVPAANEVKEVSISNIHAYPWDSSSSLIHVVLTDPEDIEKVIALHETIVYYGEDGEPQTDSVYSNYFNFTVWYTLKSGKTLQRSYSTMAGDTILALAQEIRDDYDVRYQSHRLDRLEAFKARGGYLEEVIVYDHYNGENATCFPPYAERLWNAIMADFETGRIGVKSVYSDDRNDIANLDFRWRVPMSKEEEDAGGGQYLYLEFALLDSATETQRVLNELTEAGHLYSEREPEVYYEYETKVTYD